MLPLLPTLWETVFNSFCHVIQWNIVFRECIMETNSNAKIVRSTHFFLSQMSRRTFLFQCFLLSRLSIWIRMVNQGSSYLFLAQIYSPSQENITFYKYVAIPFRFFQFSWPYHYTIGSFGLFLDALASVDFKLSVNQSE